MEINMNCCLCDAAHVEVIALPDGWEHLHDGMDEETRAFCPKHSIIKKFTDAQCPGCVGGWGNCPLWQAFAYSGEREIGPEDYEALRRGRCPRRVNGTMSLSLSRGLRSEDISEPAPIESGAALADAIASYCERYS